VNLKDFPKEDKQLALYRTVAVLLAANNIESCFEITDSVFTKDEILKIGRRILIAEGLTQGMTTKELKESINTSDKTVGMVRDKLRDFPAGFKSVFNKISGIKEEYLSKKYIKMSSGSRTVKRWIEVTDFDFKSIKR